MMGRQVVTWTSPQTGLPIPRPPFQPYVPNSVDIRPAAVDFQNAGTETSLDQDVSSGQSGLLNEALVTINASMRNWAGGEHQNYYSGAWLAISTRNKSSSTAAVTVRDFNRILRISYEQAMGLAKSRSPADAGISAAINGWLQRGELALTSDPKIAGRIANRENWAVLRSLLLDKILDDWNIKGVYQNTDFQNLPRGRETRIAVQGPTRSHMCDNVWGKITEGTHTGFVLTRRKEVIGGETYWREFYLKPWASNSPFPRDPEDYCYYDDAGVLHQTAIIYCGTVYQHTIAEPPGQGELDIILGKTGTREDVTTMKTNQVSMVLDAPTWLRRVYYTS